MSQLVVPLYAIRPEDTPLVANKAAALARLAQAGFPVPGGVCVTTVAFSSAIAPYRVAVQSVLAAHDLTQRFEAEQASEQIEKLLDGLAVPSNVTDVLGTTGPTS